MMIERDERECDLTELPRYMCAHCLGHRGPDEEERQAPAGPRFHARFDGTCDTCDEPIRVGEYIYRVPSSTPAGGRIEPARYAHVDHDD